MAARRAALPRLARLHLLARPRQRQLLDAADAATRSAYAASTELAIETQSMYAAIALTLLSAASIVFCLVMLRAGFGRRTAYLVVAAGVTSTFAPFAVMAGVPVVLSFIGLVLTAAWQLLVGARLYRLGTAAAPA
jgi:hypothetical protein